MKWKKYFSVENFGVAESKKKLQSKSENKTTSITVTTIKPNQAIFESSLLEELKSMVNHSVITFNGAVFLKSLYGVFLMTKAAIYAQCFFTKNFEYFEK